MRPHLLEICAFGPFAHAVSVDFDDLGAGGLLLLHGETGAGKTSVLDALGYALFGDVPGERGVRSLRSEHAVGSVETAVRLTFSVGGRRLRVRRTPRQELPKQRGEGTTTRQPQVLLEELLPGEPPRALATRLDEAGQTIHDLVGMTAAQFFQVVLLPQGRFAAFLHAPADQRQALLQQLFSTERFTKVEQLLRARRAELAGSVDALSRDRDGQLQQLAACHAGAELPVDLDRCVDWAHGQLVALAASLELTEARLEVQQRAGTAAARALVSVEQLAARQQRRRAAETRRAVLLAARAERVRQRTELAGARRVAPLTADLARLQRVDAETAVLEQTWVAACRRVPEAAEIADDVTALTLAERRLRSAAATAAAAVEAERALRVREAEVAAAKVAAAAATASAEARQDAVAGARDRLASLSAQLNVARVAAARVGDLQTAVATARTRLQAAAALPSARRLEQERVSRLQAARTEALDARQRWLTLTERRLTGIAAELAGRLTEGEPCAVCGSPEHPAPAAVAADAVDESAQRAAEMAAEEAAAALEPLRLQAQEASDQVAALTAALCPGSEAGAGVESPVGSDAQQPRTEQLPGERPEAGAPSVERISRGAPSLERLGREVERLTAELAAAQAAAGSLAPLERACAAAEAASAQAAADQKAADVVRGSAGEALAGLVGSLTGQQVLVRDARGDDPSVAARERRLSLLADAHAELCGCRQRYDEGAARRGELARELAAAAELAGFPDLDSARAAARDATQLAALEGALRSHDDDVAAVTALLAEPELDVPLDPPADIATAQARARTAAASLSAAMSDRADVAHRCGRGRLATERIERIQRELVPTQQQLFEVAGLAELAAGGQGNRLRMSLSAFVLAARLEQVAARASVRLATMTSGRYTLVHTDEVVDGRSRSGLGLAVRDVWTGGQRPTSSLSGGETFMTALSLALGLADVVAEEAGGHRIDTLFVDEGFGSLDEHALDRVMDVLDGLRDGGRLVGLVSHVGELQRRIPSRLEVVRSESGSWLRAHLAPVG